jgi:hypothetical protein
MCHLSGQYVCDRFYSAVRVPGKALKIIGWVIPPEIIQQEEGVEKVFIAETECPFQVHPCAFQGWAAGRCAFYFAGFCHENLLFKMLYSILKGAPGRIRPGVQFFSNVTSQLGHLAT